MYFICLQMFEYIDITCDHYIEATLWSGFDLYVKIIRMK